MGLKYLENVATLSLDAEKCVGCERCMEVCPHGVFDVAGGKALITDKDLCMECGACAMNCPTDAIKVKVGVGCAVAVRNVWGTDGEPYCDCDGNACCSN
jgi:NAD-dependent dihydropyrimidine dehydrogenase PreA subunit